MTFTIERKGTYYSVLCGNSSYTRLEVHRDGRYRPLWLILCPDTEYLYAVRDSAILERLEKEFLKAVQKWG